jgi:hypothetical protein
MFNQVEWQEKEVNYLMEHYDGQDGCVARIATQLGRTKNSVKRKAQRLGITFVRSEKADVKRQGSTCKREKVEKMRDYYVPYDIQIITGIPEKTIKDYLCNGTLYGKKYGQEWHVKHATLREFIKRYRQELRADKLDIQELLAVLV